MRKCDNYLCCSGYKYAPEQFKAYRVTGFSYGNRNIPEYEEIKLTMEETRECGYELCTKGKKAAIAKLKTILRKQEQNQKKYCTYGFILTDNKKRYAFVRELYILDTARPIDKLRIFKNVKDHMEHNNWEVSRYIETKLGMNESGYTIEEQKEIKDKINSNKPCKIYFKQ